MRFLPLLISLTFLIQLLASKTTNAQVVINEIMANPNNGKLPLHEYIEIFNAGNIPIQMSDYTLGVNNNRMALPTYILAPKQYIILCSQNASTEFQRLGNVIALNSWSALSNTRAKITLFKNAQVSDEVSYQNTWHTSTAKRNGGWSLERINPNLTCGLSTNWTSSLSPNGGTPGRANSVLNNKASPRVSITNSILNKTNINLTFNLDYDYLKVLTASDFEVDKTIGNPSFLQWNNTLDTLTLFFNSEFQTDEIYTLQIKAFQLCSSLITLPKESLFHQSEISNDDIIISEILFNPKEGGVDFVEIYNTTDRPINLKNWALGNRIISPEILLIQSKEYLAISTNKTVIAFHYPSARINNIIEVPSIPSYANQQGIVTLLNPKQKMIDSIYYNANMHDKLISNRKGISLERQSVNPTNKGYKIFKSASTIQEGATPGYQNSININNSDKKNNIFLTSKTVSPNNDSYEDYLEINYELSDADYYMNIAIYNDKGTLINRLIRNERAGTTGLVKWDIKGENGQKSPPGYYIAIIEIYDSKGGRKRFKEAFVIVPNSLSY